MEPLVEKAADPSLSQAIKQRVSQEAKKVSTWEDLLIVCPEFAEAITDATEQQRQRPAKKDTKEILFWQEKAPYHQDSDYHKHERQNPYGK